MTAKKLEMAIGIAMAEKAPDIRAIYSEFQSAEWAWSDGLSMPDQRVKLEDCTEVETLQVENSGGEEWWWESRT